MAGLVERVTFHNGETGFCVLRVKARGQRDLVTVVGHAASISPGEWVQMSGAWVNDRAHGLQFKAAFLKATAPTTLEGIEKYLDSGMICGIGPVYAKRLVRAFGEAVFELIEQAPGRLHEVTGIGPRRARRIVAGCVKVTVMLEELLALGHAGAEYDAWLIKIGDGDQFGSGFVSVNPNSKIPVLMDRSGPTPIRVFESGAILVYLAEKFEAFLPTEASERAECLSWLFWQMGSAPYLGGGFGHFYAYAPTKIEYAIDRFAMEAKRQLDVLDRRLAGNEYLAGKDYTIADIAVWPWYGGLAKGWLYGAAEFLAVEEYKNVQRWADAIGKRPAVQRGRMVNRVTGEPSSQLHERHDAGDFETKTQDKLVTES